MSQQFNGTDIHRAILEAVSAYGQVPANPVAENEDLFATYGLNSLDTFRAIVQLEKLFGIEIGEEPSDFERARTLSGLKSMVTERLDQRDERV